MPRAPAAPRAAPEAGRGQDAVAVEHDRQRLVAAQAGGPGRAVRAERERRGRVGVGGAQVRPTTVTEATPRRRAPRPRVADVRRRARRRRTSPPRRRAATSAARSRSRRAGGGSRSATGRRARRRRRRRRAAGRARPPRRAAPPRARPPSPSRARTDPARREWRASNAPPVAARSASQRSSTSRTSGCASAGASAPRSSRLISLSARTGRTSRRPSAASRTSRRAPPPARRRGRRARTGIPITCSTRSATARVPHRGLQRLDPALARVRRARDGVDPGAAREQRLARAGAAPRGR